MVEVDAEFSTDAGVALCQQRRRDEHKVDASLVRGCTESTHVAQHSSTQHYEASVPVHQLIGKVLPDVRAGCEGLLPLATFYLDHRMCGQSASHEGVAVL